MLNFLLITYFLPEERVVKIVKTVRQNCNIATLGGVPPPTPLQLRPWVCVLLHLLASANWERVFHQMFLNLVGNIFALREATFCVCNKSQCFQIWDTGKHLGKH